TSAPCQDNITQSLGPQVLWNEGPRMTQPTPGLPNSPPNIGTAASGTTAALPVGSPHIQVIRAGDTVKPNPFTICIVANPALEAPWTSGQFMADPIAA